MIPRTYVTFKWDDKEAFRQIDQMVSNIDNIFPVEFERWGDMLTDAIRSFTPHVTGERQASIGKYDPTLISSHDPAAHMRAKSNAVFKMRRIKQDTWEVVVGSNSDIVVYLNYGTTRIKPLHMFERGQAAAAPLLRPAIQKALDVSTRPSGWIQAGRWTTVQSHNVFNPAIGGGGSLLRASRRKVRISRVSEK